MVPLIEKSAKTLVEVISESADTNQSVDVHRYVYVSSWTI